MTTIHSALQEMQSFVQVSKTTMDKAEDSLITTENNSTMRELWRDWGDGVYDNDPETLAQELANLLKKDYQPQPPLENF